VKFFTETKEYYVLFEVRGLQQYWAPFQKSEGADPRPTRFRCLCWTFGPLQWTFCPPCKFRRCIVCIASINFISHNLLSEFDVACVCSLSKMIRRHTMRPRNLQGAKRPVGKASWGRSIKGAKRPVTHLLQHLTHSRLWLLSLAVFSRL